MSISFIEFLQQLAGSKTLLLTVLLTLGVIFVTGWTDAPNAIATCITTRCMRPRSAILLSAVFNFLGVFLMTQLNSSVAFTISNMVDFGGDTRGALIALCAALLSIVIYSVGASFFGIPTSESHSLIAGLTGAAIAIQNGLRGVNFAEWVKVLYGLVLSVALGFAVGWCVCRAVTLLFYRAERRKANRFFHGAQIVGAAAMSFMHGAQDGQKFMGVLILGITFCGGAVGGGGLPVWLMLLCSVVMAVGTSVGGERIIKAVGMDMVHLEKYQGFSADFSAALCLLFSSLFGIPVSTTHTKTSAIMGVGAVKRLGAINFGVVRGMVLTWVCTFPACGVISYVMAKLFLRRCVRTRCGYGREHCHEEQLRLPRAAKEDTDAKGTQNDARGAHRDCQLLPCARQGLCADHTALPCFVLSGLRLAAQVRKRGRKGSA